MRRLYIAAKAPRPGFVKTRLARFIGPDSATALYAGFLRDISARFASEGVDATWFVTPDDCWGEIAAAAGVAEDAPATNQGPGSWGERQDRLFAAAALRGESPVVLISSDSPQIPVSYVHEAFELLAGHDLVIGPVLDGGYCLIGMRGYHDVLRQIPMSTPDVLEAIRSRAASLDLRVAALRATFDVDELEDLGHLEAACRERTDLVETSRSLALIRAAGWT